MRLNYLVLVAALGLAGCVDVILEPPPLETLTPAQRASLIYYPPEAKANGVPGLVLLSCEISPAHRLNDCEVRYESLPGWGFGVAALRTADSVIPDRSIPIGAMVTQTIVFCNTEGGCVQMQRLSADMLENMRRRRAEAGLPPAVYAPDGALQVNPGEGQ